MSGDLVTTAVPPLTPSDATFVNVVANQSQKAIQAVMMPLRTTATAASLATEGMVIYDTTLNKLMVCTATSPTVTWEAVTSTNI